MGRFLDGRLKGLVPYTPGEQPKARGELIKLNTNENPYPPPRPALEAVSRAAFELYPDPTCAGLRSALAEFHGVRPEQIIAGNGSDELLAFCFYALCPEGALFPDVTYGFYPVLSDLYGVSAGIVPLREDFSVRVSDYEGKRGTVFLANPNAPTGIFLPLSDVESLLKQDRQRLVVVDEAYVDFGGETAIPLLEKYDNLLVIHTFSKSRQMAGARLAYAVGPEDIISDLGAVKYSFNPYSANSAALLAGEASVRDREYFDMRRDMIIKTRERTAERLRELGFTLTDSRANFIFAKPPEMSGEEYFLALREKNIIVRYFPAERTRDYVRVSVGTAEQMDRFIRATEEILAGRR